MKEIYEEIKLIQEILDNDDVKLSNGLKLKLKDKIIDLQLQLMTILEG